MMVGVCEKGEGEYNRGNESKGIYQLWLANMDGKRCGKTKE